MSLLRHDEPLVRGYAVTHPAGEVHLPTQPGWHQILCTRSGALVARTEDAAWTVPPHRALCVADGTRLRVRTSHPTAVRCLYLATELATMAVPLTVVHVSPLVRELLADAVERSPLDLGTDSDRARVLLLVDQFGTAPSESLQLPLPQDDRARTVAEAILADPAAPLAEVAAGAAASRRTLERRFRAETGLAPSAWQRRARLLASIPRLGAGCSVTEAATSLGYSTASAFVAAFHSELGNTPRAYTRQSRPAPVGPSASRIIDLVRRI